MNTELINVVMIIALTACVYMLYKELSVIEKEMLSLKKFVYGERVIPLTNLFQPQQPQMGSEPNEILNVINDTIMKGFNKDIQDHDETEYKTTECKITELPVQPIEEKETEQDFIETNIESKEQTIQTLP